jgi:uncharacterized protein
MAARLRMTAAENLRAIRERAPGLALLSTPVQFSRMKSAGKIARLAIVLVVLTAGLHAEPIAQLHPSNYVNDFAGVLDANTLAQLDDVCQQIDTKAHAQIAVATIKSLDDADIVSYAVELYQKWGIGTKGTDRGVLILVAVQDRKYWTTVGYGLEPILPDGKVGGFGREALPLLRQNDYRGAVSLMVLRVADVIAQDAGVQLTGARAVPAMARRENPGGGPSALKIVIFIVIGIIVLVTPPLRRLLFWFLIFGGGRGGGYGGGGFGGGGFGGGGGGFGGFGGGSTGGGGAGGSW